MFVSSKIAVLAFIAICSITFIQGNFIKDAVKAVVDTIEEKIPAVAVTVDKGISAVADTVDKGISAVADNGISAVTDKGFSAVDNATYAKIDAFVTKKYPDKAECMMMDDFKRNKVAHEISKFAILYTDNGLSQELKPFIDEVNLKCDVVSFLLSPLGIGIMVFIACMLALSIIFGLIRCMCR